MVKRECEVLDPEGLHARPASKVVMVSMEFKSDICMIHGSKRADAKNILELLALGVGWKDRILVYAEGADEIDALEAVSRTFTYKDGLNPTTGTNK